MEVLKVARDGAQTTRLTARGAIAVTATHGAQGHQCLAAKHTEQVARQAAAQQALLCAEHLASCAAQPRYANRSSSRCRHRNVASNNLRRLQRINSQDERVSLSV